MSGSNAFIHKMELPETSGVAKTEGTFRAMLSRFVNLDALQSVRGISASQRPETSAILSARRELGGLGQSIADLNRKIERLESIRTKWQERGSVLDLRS